MFSLDFWQQGIATKFTKSDIVCHLLIRVTQLTLIFCPMPAHRRLFRAQTLTLLKRVALVVAVLAGIFSLWTLSTVYEQRKLMHQHQAERELQTIGRLQAQAVADWRASRLANANALTDDSLFAQAVARWRSTSGTSAQDGAFVEERLRILQERSRYSAASFVAPDGAISLGASSGKFVPDAERRALSQALESATTGVVEPRRDPFFAFPFFSMMAPIFDGIEPLGAVWLVMDVRTSLYPLLAPWPTASETAESVLIQDQGKDAVLLSPMRRQDSTMAVIDSGSNAARPKIQAVAGARGLLYGRDDHGTEVMAVVNAIAESPWLLVSQIEVQEAFGNAATRELLVLSLPVSLAVLVAGLLLGGWQWAARRRESALKDKLAQNMQWLESAQKAALVGYYVYESKGDTFTLSPMASELFGLPSEAPVARAQWLAQVHPADRPHVLATLDDALRARKPLRMQHRLLDGSKERWVDIWGDHEASSVDADMTGTVQDITERQRAEEKLGQYRVALEALVRQDPMTGVANRRALTEALTAEWQRAMRTQSPLSVLMIDVDHFKAFNDRYGHLAGDECLRKVARALARTATRATDLVARYGGEEFAVLLPGTSSEEALEIAKKLRIAVRKLAIAHAASSVASVVTISTGVATTQALPAARSDEPDRLGLQANAERECQNLLHQADLALYAAKEGGRDAVVAHEDTQSDSMYASLESPLTPLPPPPPRRT